MKKIAVLVLAMLLLSTGMAESIEWREGLSPSKPYDGVAEIDLSKQMGYMMFYPSADMKIENACQRLYIYLPREDVEIGEGTFYLCTESDGVVFKTEMGNADAVSQRAIDENELVGLLWATGTCFEIQLPKTLELGKTYFVNMTRGCILTENGIESPEIGGTDTWAFTVEGDFGVSSMQYCRQTAGGYEEGLTKPMVGDEIRFDLTLGGEAATAIVYGYGGSVDFLPTAYDASGEVTGTVTAENPVWGVLFLDAEGNALGQVQF